MTLNGVMAVTLRYFTEFGKPVLQKAICGGIYASVYCILVRVQCRRKESSRSLSHLLMSFLYYKENGRWGNPFLPEILGQTDRVGAKTPIFNRYSPVALQP